MHPPQPRTFLEFSRSGLMFIAPVFLLSAVCVAQNIGDPIGRSGQWPLLETPPGNVFQSTANNAYEPAAGSHTEFLALLGLALFWDEQVSTNNTMACATCHSPENAGVDSRPAFAGPNNGSGSSGVLPMDGAGNYTVGTPTSQQRQVTPLVAPTMIGAAFASKLFWDTRVGPGFPMALAQSSLFMSNAALEAQSVEPPLSSIEMAHSGLAITGWGQQGSPGELENKLNASKMLALATLATVPPPLQPFVSLGLTYQQIFDFVFSMPNSVFPGAFGVTRERIAVAIAAYERTLVPDQAPIDMGALTPPNLPVTTPSEQRGFNHLANSGCFRCHSDQPNPPFFMLPVLTGTGGFQDAMDAMLTDNRRHGNIGFPSPPGATGVALGSFGVKTPSLRNVLLRPRWGHNGFFTDFSTLLSFYNGTLPGTNPVFPFTSGSLQGQLDTNELADVMAFFQALTDQRLVPSTPGGPLGSPFWHPDLHSQRHPFGSTESALHPGTPPPGGLTPDIILHVPLASGSSNYNVGVRDAPPLSPIGVLGISPSGLTAIPTPPLMLNTGGLITVNFPLIAPTSTATDAAGFATLLFPPLPPLPGGLSVSLQTVFIDPVSGQLAWSNAGTVTVQP